MKKALTHVWSVVCSNSLLDKDTNNLSLFNTIEKFTFQIPESDMEKLKKEKKENIVFPAQFEVVSRFARQESGTVEAFDYKVSLMNPENKSVAHSMQKLAVDKNIKNFRVRTKFQSLPVNGLGDYIVLVEFKEVSENRYNKVAELPLEVTISSIPEKK